MAKQKTDIATAIAFGLKWVDPNLVNNDRVACACYFAAINFPALAVELNELGDVFSRLHASLPG